MESPDRVYRLRVRMWVLVAVVGAWSLGCHRDDIVEPPPATPTIESPPPPPRLPLGRHWPHQTFDDMFQIDDPAKPVIEHARPIIGVAYGELLKAIGEPVTTEGCGGTVMHPKCGTWTRDAFYLPGFVDDEPMELYVYTETRDDPTALIESFTLNFPGLLADTVPALLRKQLGPPNRPWAPTSSRSGFAARAASKPSSSGPAEDSDQRSSASRARTRSCDPSPRARSSPTRPRSPSASACS